MNPRLNSQEYLLRFVAIGGIFAIIVLLVVLLNRDSPQVAEKPELNPAQPSTKRDRPLSPLTRNLFKGDSAGTWGPPPDGENSVARSAEQVDAEQVDKEGQGISFEIGRLRDANKAPVATPTNASDSTSQPHRHVRVAGDHHGQVTVLRQGEGYQFRYRGHTDAEHMSLVGNFNSWDFTNDGMRLQGDEWICEIVLPASSHEFKFLGPDDAWFPAGDNLAISVTKPISPPQAPGAELVTTPPAATSPGEFEKPAFTRAAAEKILDDAGLYEGRPGVWFFPQSSRLVVRQYGRLAKTPKIQSALKRLNARLPNSAEMSNPPPRR